MSVTFRFGRMIEIGAWVLGAWAVVVGLMFVFQRSMLYYPFDRPEPSALRAAGFRPMPNRTEDGLDLVSWYRPAATDKATVLFLQGNAGHLGHRLPVVAPLIRAGYGVALAAYRGYGGSPGKPTEAGLYADGRAALAALSSEGVAADRMILWGESLGSGVATQLATETRVMALVLIAPFTSVADRAWELYPFVPTGLLVLDRFDNHGRIDRLRAPLLIAHGEGDDIVPARHGRRLLEKAREPKRGLFVPRLGHNDLLQPEVMARILEFFRDVEAKRL